MIPTIISIAVINICWAILFWWSIRKKPTKKTIGVITKYESDFHEYVKKQNNNNDYCWIKSVLSLHGKTFDGGVMYYGTSPVDSIEIQKQIPSYIKINNHI